MDMGLAGKTAIVTGGAMGVGKAMTLALAAEGVRVAIADINLECSRQVVQEIAGKGGRAIAIGTDVSRSEDVKAMVQRALAEFKQIDILCANAGVVGPQGPWSELPEEGFDRVVGINFKGQYLACKYVAKHMMERKSGKIIITSSCAGKTGERFNGCYSATKATGVSLTQSLAWELAPYNVTVNAVCPAAMDTDLMEEVYRERAKWFGLTPDEFRHKIQAGFPLPYGVTVEDVAKLTVFLCSEHARSITGQSINVTGGIEMH